MKRDKRRRLERGAGKRVPGKGSARRGSVTPWIIVGVLSLVLVGTGVGVVPARGSHHPDPRSEITGETVAPASRYAGYPRVNAVYAQAAEIAAILDGLYCYCDCSRHSGHRSLLSCFETDHGAACDVCLTEATVAHRMTEDGRSLDEIRDAIDEFYGR